MIDKYWAGIDHGVLNGDSCCIAKIRIKKRTFWQWLRRKPKTIEIYEVIMHPSIERTKVDPFGVRNSWSGL